MEAIRKRLQELKWVRPLQTSVSGSPAVTPGEDTVSVTEVNGGICTATSNKQPGGGGGAFTLNDREEDWRLTLLNKALETLTVTRFGGDKLRLIAEGLLEGIVTREEGAEQLEILTQEFAPLKWQTCAKRRGLRKEPRSKKQVRRARYAHIQKLCKLKRKDAAHSVLEGRWREAYRGVDRGMEGVEEHWAEVLGTKTNVAGPWKVSHQEAGNIKWELMDPVTGEEVEVAIRSMKRTLAGMDKLTAQELLSCHLPSLAGLLNIIMATERLPSILAMARVTLIPKVEAPSGLSDFRPIAITSVLARALHKIISKWMRELFQFSPLQHAFLQQDGCLEASALLHAVLRHSHEKTKPLTAVFLDVSKAFDTVSHNAILGAAEKAGTPPPLLRYLHQLYKNAKLHLGNLTTDCSSGIRQGDPISPILFILAMGEILEQALPEVGVKWGSYGLDRSPMLTI